VLTWALPVPLIPGLAAQATADPWHDLQVLWSYPFMRHALVAGTAVAVMGAVVGWFVVMRKEAYATHSLAMVAFPGATAAALAGLAPVAGYFAAAVLGAGAMAALDTGAGAAPGPHRRHSAVVGTVQAAALALGLLFASLYRGFLANVTSFLFGSFLGISATEATVLVVVAVAVLAAVAFLGRPLLFASVDPAVAAGAGLPVRALGAAFLVLVAVAVAGASQFTGVLLVFSLVITPPATAQVLTARPGRSVAASVAIGVTIVWAGLGAAFFTDRPAGFWITTIGFAGYLAARIGSAIRRRVSSR
jgi:zinc/manganese transport system permease protein